jgi:hypothetical protein
VLKKLRRSLLTAHRCQINHEPSPNHLAFQITRTTISPNYPGEVFEVLDREVLVVSVDVPPEHGETEEQRIERENTNTARDTCRQQEADAAAAAGQPVANTVQGADNQPAGNVGAQAPAAPKAPQQHQQHNEPR